MTREPALNSAYELEVAALHACGAVELAEGVFAVGGEGREASATRMELLPLAAAATPTELVAAVGALSWGADARFAQADWELTHERRGVLASHVPSPELYALLSDACGRGERRLRAPSRSRTAAEPVLRFGVVETPSLCIFGLVVYAPIGEAAAAAVWSTRPHNYCAALPFNLARIAVNIATADGHRGGVLLDPTCGSGTVLFAAASAGLRARGVEFHPLVATQAAENLRLAGEAGLPGWVAPTVQQGDCLVAPLPREVSGVVANLPFGRMAFVAGEVAAAAADHEAAVHLIMQRMMQLGGRQVFFCERELGGAMRELGYKDVREVSVCARGRRFMMSGRLD